MAMLNAVSLFSENALLFPQRTALHFLKENRSCTFSELSAMASAVQNALQEMGLNHGDCMLVFAPLSPELYAVIIGAMARGVALLFVEPWMPLPLVSRVIGLMRPRIFVTPLIGALWGFRVPEVRRITWRMSPNQLIDAGSPGKLPSRPIAPVMVSPDTRGIVTFTSGTTGLPKGVSRPHGYLVDAARTFNSTFHMNADSGTDLCIFANFALLNLAAGRPTVLFPSIPTAIDFEKIRLHSELNSDLRPQSLTCGPAFLRDVLGSDECISGVAPFLKHVHVGGAVSDCSLWEQAFSLLPHVSFTHIYGSSEVEPVACGDARTAVLLSRSKGFFQNLCIGTAIPEIEILSINESLWVSGKHVCPEYITASESDSAHKRRDSSGLIWHNMGDRICDLDSNGCLWYLGRCSKPLEHIFLEQKIFNELGSSEGFLIEHKKKGLFLVTSQRSATSESFKNLFCQVDEVLVVPKILRDKRHRARVDVLATIKRNAPWLVG